MPTADNAAHEKAEKKLRRKIGLRGNHLQTYHHRHCMRVSARKKGILFPETVFILQRREKPSSMEVWFSSMGLALCRVRNSRLKMPGPRFDVI